MLMTTGFRQRGAGAARRATLLVLALAALPVAPAAAQAPEKEADEAESTGEPAAAADPPRATELTLRAEEVRVWAGRSVTLTGRRRPGERDRKVELEYRPVGGEYRTVGSTRTGRRGGFLLIADPERSGTFRATTAAEPGEETVRSQDVEIAATSELYVHGQRHQLADHGLRVAGRLDPHRPDRRILLQRLTGKGWQTEEVTRTGGDGRYAIRWRGASLGRVRVRTVFRGTNGLEGDKVRLDHPVYMYRKDEASYYGPGFYGNQTACGQTLRRDTMGVAHKTLPCGTRVRFHYRDKTRKVPVIDRGPYIDGRRWDLTEATRAALDFPKGVAQVWATR